MAQKTANYQLNQWEPEDDFLRTDFNEDNAKIEAALNLKCAVIVGSYTGNNAAERTISLGATPKAVFVCSRSGIAGESGLIYGGLAVTGSGVNSMNSGTVYSPAAVEITEGGFIVRYSGDEYVGAVRLFANFNIVQYNYIAVF